MQRYGLSEVINHLLGRDPPTPFDMLVMGRFLRCSLRSVLQRNALSGEAVLEVEYLPAMRQPTEAEHTEQAGRLQRPRKPDWVSAVASGGEGEGFFVTGSYDGCLRTYSSNLKISSVEKAHDGPITTLCRIPSDASRAGGGGGGQLFLSGGKDMTARVWRAISGSDRACSLGGIALLRGHANSVSSAFASGQAAFTGDWSGRVCRWDVVGITAAAGEGEGNQAKKRLKKSPAGWAATTLLQPEPTASFQAHSQAVTGLAGPGPGPGHKLGAGDMGVDNGGSQENTLYSSSLDRAIKTWDVERQDCVSTLNAPKSITCLACSFSGRVLATGHPDARVRIWDTRTKGETLTRASLSSHKQWVSSVAFIPRSETMVISCAYDGAVKLWDTRSSVPLHTAKAHGDKALTVMWHEGKIVSGGGDGAVKSYLVPDAAD
ncbi:unnamed protein product [Discosporangium mesarthrocarpum]